MPIEKICIECKRKFKVSPSQQNKKSCCIECYRKNQNKNINNYVMKNDYCELHIENKFSKRFVVVLLSLSDVDKVKKGNWGACFDKTINNYYIRGQIGKLKIQLHRYLTNCPEGMQVDHINRDTLDNRQDNLRIVTNKENSHNKGQYGIPNKFDDKGICYHKTRNRYCVRLNGDNIGTFKTLEEAKEAKQLYLEGKLQLKSKRVYRKSVKCVETNKVYKTIREASRDTNINRSTIEACCNGKTKTAGGLHWKVLATQEGR